MSKINEAEYVISISKAEVYMTNLEDEETRLTAPIKRVKKIIVLVDPLPSDVLGEVISEQVKKMVKQMEKESGE